MFRVLFVFLCSGTVCLSLNAETRWTGFRGPSGQGVTAEKNLPLTWSETENVTWKTSVPGKGWSSPVVWDDQIWLTTAVEQTPSEDEKNELLAGEKQPQARQVAKIVSLRAICIQRQSGKIVHDVELVAIEDPDPIHLLNSYASPTPIIEGNRLYCHFGTYGTYCIDTNTTELVWKQREAIAHAVGPGSSPAMHENVLVLVCDGMGAQYVTGLDKYTGNVIWKTPRPPMEGSDGDFHKAFSTALIVESDGGAQAVVPGAQWFAAYDIANGNMLWHVNHGKGFSNVAAPVFADGISYVITGFTKPELWAIPVASRGELTAADVLWEQKKRVPKKSSPALVGTEIYMAGDDGVLSCVDINSGDILWTKRLGGKYSASPIFNDQSIYVCNHEGKTFVFKPNSKEFELLAENQLDGQLMASPVPCEGALFIRSDTHLYRIEEK